MNHLIQASRPGLLLGDRPERAPAKPLNTADQWLSNAWQEWKNPIRTLSEFKPVLKRVLAEEQRLAALNASALAQQINYCRQKLQGGSLDITVAEQLFAAIRLAARSTHNVTLHTEQLFAGWAMLHGNIVEMNTGEGKTLTAALPAIVVALTGTPVHVITVNEYLMQRDATALTPLYTRFGLRVSVVNDSMSDDERHKAYGADIVYCTNKQIVFDYLRDLQQLDGYHLGLKSRLRSLLSTAPTKPVLRGLCFAIIDEADSVMIDDARTPLILAEPLQAERSAVTESAIALGVARTLHEGADFRIQHDTHSVWLTETGLDAVRNLAERLNGVWRFERYRNELVRQALCALHLYRRDRHYLVRNGCVELIDEATGRLMPDRKLQHGLHRMLELKESCSPSDETGVKAAISFQSFFRRYRHLTGMSGTIYDVRSELRQVYGRGVVKIPPHKKNHRRYLPTIVLNNRTEQLERALQEVLTRTSLGQPLLIGTRSVELSEQVSDLLHVEGIPHELLNARQDADEARVVANAGRPGAITVATNMAGRGTDIPLQANASELGGLHVINLEINESSRVDRQLYGRAARQGDPGSCQSILSLSDELVTKTQLRKIANLADNCLNRHPRLGQWLALQLVEYAQRRCERIHRQQRITVFQEQDQLNRQLAISGKGT
ncbi:DEAD/DEAH box helicase [Granulosicoccus antarcticus]|uniref:Protein translocase subunit SecA n=1 Tax=Granulosicoccus antarcticus IMCC3135 TaxID=1192854 RepID=A0A2Z2NSQ9_9GAMM|nr:DEAD/DEAH box helicase [Granulosicoccus antarcticus]ASJ70627.1 Protein translocase subunit SecA [Granulosicoccus antarcticus IMCC3135]